MIWGYMGLALNLLTVGVISFVVALFIICTLSQYPRRVSVRFNACAKRRLLWGLVTIPWLASFVSIALLILPELTSTLPAWLSSITHFHHAYEFMLEAGMVFLCCYFAASFFSILCSSYCMP